MKSPIEIFRNEATGAVSVTTPTVFEGGEQGSITLFYAKRTKGWTGISAGAASVYVSPSEGAENKNVWTELYAMPAK